MLRGIARTALLAFSLLVACGAEPPGQSADRAATVRSEAVAIAQQGPAGDVRTAAPASMATPVPASATPGPVVTASPATPIAVPPTARPPLPPPPMVPTATPHPGYPGQSNLVPPGYPTPETAFERLVPGGPARHPGSLAWARPGPYLGAAFDREQVQSFRGDARLATTYYFYWHDLTDPARRARFTERFNLPPNPDRYHYLFPDTHYREFADMRAAGLDFVLPVYWGEPGHPGRTTGPTSPHYWSTEGIAPMVEALDRLAGEGNALKLGLFYDTTILANADLRTEVGREYFYINVRDFYSRIPPRHWAAIDGRPVVWLYDTLWVASFDQGTLDYLARRFAADFGGLQPYVVAESQWEFAKHAGDTPRLRVDGLYGWGAAPFGFNVDGRFTIAQVGPGFKNTQFCQGGAAQNCFDIDREGGRRYERQLQQAVASGRRIIAVETWNEFSEGTEIAETRRDGRQYIELTRRYLDRWRGRIPPN